MKVKPAGGRAVRDPLSLALLPEDGREVSDDDPFWLRRVRDGDVTVEGAQEAPEIDRRVKQAMSQALTWKQTAAK